MRCAFNVFSGKEEDGHGMNNRLKCVNGEFRPDADAQGTKWPVCTKALFDLAILIAGGIDTPKGQKLAWRRDCFASHADGGDGSVLFEKTSDVQLVRRPLNVSEPVAARMLGFRVHASHE